MSASTVSQPAVGPKLAASADKRSVNVRANVPHNNGDQLQLVNPAKAKPAQRRSRPSREDTSALKRRMIHESWRKSPVRKAFAALVMLGAIILALPSAMGQQAPLSLQSSSSSESGDSAEQAAAEQAQSEQLLTDAFGQKGLS